MWQNVDSVGNNMGGVHHGYILPDERVNNIGTITETKVLNGTLCCYSLVECDSPTTI